MAKIVTVYSNSRRSFTPVDMSYIRWWKISEALARCGHQVDIATNEARWWFNKSPRTMGPNLRRIPLSTVRWNEYDVVKSLFHTGFNTLERRGANKHPFIIAKVGSVVGPKEMNGIYFYGDERSLYSTQERIYRGAKYVTVLSKPERALWKECFNRDDNILLVPGGVDQDIPAPEEDPYPKHHRLRCIFAGNVYTKKFQPDANAVLIDKLNRLGEHLSNHGIRLYMLGSGNIENLNPGNVTYLGLASYQKAWDYFHFANVGIVVAAGKFSHNKESSKIYSYLRAGLPVVSEAGFPNDHVVVESKLGFVVENDRLDLMADKIAEAASTKWDRDHAIRYIIDQHSWDKRVEVYDQLFRAHFA